LFLIESAGFFIDRTYIAFFLTPPRCPDPLYFYCSQKEVH